MIKAIWNNGIPPLGDGNFTLSFEGTMTDEVSGSKYQVVHFAVGDLALSIPLEFIYGEEKST